MEPTSVLCEASIVGHRTCVAKTCLPLFHLPPLPYQRPETVLLASLLFGRLKTPLAPKLRLGWEAKFCFGVLSGEPKRARAGSVRVELSFG